MSDAAASRDETPTLHVPLQCGGTAAARICVAPGTRVVAGQRIGEGGGDAVDAFAPVGGTVIGPARAWIRGGGWVDALEIRADVDPSGELIDAAGARQNAPSADLIQRLIGAGDLRDAEGHHLAMAAAAARDASVRALIVRCFAGEPGDGDADASQPDSPACERIVRSAMRLAGAIGAERVWLAVGRDSAPSAFRAWRAAAAVAGRDDPSGGVRIRVVAVPADYPTGHPILLTRAITGAETPPGRSTRNVGAWVITAATLAALDEFLESGRPRTSVSVVVGGSGAVVQRLSVPIGTPIRSLAQEAAGDARVVRIVAGGWLTGAAVESDEAVVDADTTAIWVFDEIPHREPIPCVRCGKCVDACPVGLSPIAIHDCGDEARAAPADQPLEACIACGMCTSLCPSELPLAVKIVAWRDAVPLNATPGSRVRDRFGGIGSTQGGTVKRTRLAVTCARTQHGQRSTVDRATPPPTPALSRAARSSPMLDPPQSVSGATYRHILGAWYVAAAFPVLAGLILFGPAAGKILVAAVGAAILTEAILDRARRPAIRGNLAHAGLMGLLVGLTLPANGPLAAALLGGVVAVAFGKIALGGIGRYLWQPALVGRVAVQFVFAQQLSLTGALAHSPVLAADRLVFGDVTSASEVAAGANQGWANTPSAMGDDAILVERPVQVLRRLADGVASNGAEPPMLVALRDELPPWQDTLLGTVPGGIGETASVALIVAMLYLMMRGVLRWQLPCGILMAALLMAWVCPIRQASTGTYAWWPGSIVVEHWPLGLIYVLYHLTSGQLLLGAALLAGDPTASPLTGRGQWLFGLGIGAITIFMRLYGLLEGECYWAILMMNTLTPWIDRKTRPRVLGARARE